MVPVRIPLNMHRTNDRTNTHIITRITNIHRTVLRDSMCGRDMNRNTHALLQARLRSIWHTRRVLTWIIQQLVRGRDITMLMPNYYTYYYYAA